MRSLRDFVLSYTSFEATGHFIEAFFNKVFLSDTCHTLPSDIPMAVIPL